MKTMAWLWKTLISGILAGISIALGGTVYLLTPDKTVGALLFAVGLFCVCAFGFSLFTGKVCYVFDNDRKYALALPVIWIGNLIGTVAVAGLESLTWKGPALAEAAAAVCRNKLTQDPLSAVILAVFCNIMIYIAVEGYKNIPHEIGKYMAILFGVVVFILCGFEHCVANMYYFTMGNAWDSDAVVYLGLMTLGNAAGGVLIPLLRRMSRMENKDGAARK